MGRVKPCKCLGISGSCTLLSCSNEFPDFSATARKLLYLYHNHSCLAVNTDDSLGDEYYLVTRNSNTSSPQTSLYVLCAATGPDTLLYLDESPNYCRRNETVGSLGTAGRECDPLTNGTSNSCDNLCTQCGRQYRKLAYTFWKSCNCRFRYCCDINCHLCSQTRDIFVCL